MAPHPTCIDCEHALPLADEPHTVACAAHLEYFPADKLATCSAFILLSEAPRPLNMKS